MRGGEGGEMSGIVDSISRYPAAPIKYDAVTRFIHKIGTKSNTLSVICHHTFASKSFMLMIPDWGKTPIT